MSLDPDLGTWLDQNATALDADAGDPATLLKRLADAGLFRIGAAARHGGSG